MTAKSYIKILLLLALTGCNGDFLQIEPDSFVSASSYFKNQDEAILAVNGAYSPLQRIAAENWWILGELRSDNTTYQYNEGDRRNLPKEQVDEFLMQVNNPHTDGFWKESYSGISRCNVILNRIGTITFNDPQIKDRLTGEVLFLRGLYYFNLVRLFGGVPLVKDEILSPDDKDKYAIAKASKEEIFAQIVEDVKAAAAKLPAKYTGADLGRATKGAANTLLGEVYMTTKEFPLAVTAFNEVINGGYSLLPDYASVFDPKNKNHAESIFEVQYFESNQGKGSNFIYRFAPFNSGADIVGDNQLLGYNAGFNIPTHDLLNMYEKGDVRKAASIGWYVKDGNDEFDVAIGDSIPYINKYNHPHSIPAVTNDNWPVFRYSRVLLLQAEALNETGKTAEAYPLINQVRQRAKLAPLATGLSQGNFREAVYHETQIEVAFENHRWFDLLRTGTAEQVMKAHGERQKAGISRLAGAYNIMPYQLLYPIPTREMTLNVKLVQNEGWK